MKLINNHEHSASESLISQIYKSVTVSTSEEGLAVERENLCSFNEQGLNPSDAFTPSTIFNACFKRN